MSLEVNGPVVLAGAGKMGTALLAGWLEGGLAARNLLVQEPNLTGAAQALISKHGIAVAPIIPSLPVAPAVIVVAVKPQTIDEVFPALAKLAGEKTVVMSIAAGKSIAGFERYLPPKTAVVRAMPNTPAAIGRGITGAVGNAYVTASQKELCQTLLGAVGEVVWLDDETLIDAVTAVSGSGPAYVFLLTEALAEAAASIGLDRQTAMQLARATVSGAGALLDASSEDPATLRRNVTSPGGTTAAALAVLMRERGGLKELMAEAVLAAQRRSRELGI
jgi:pyrroline-5-carboxylate reductase